MEEISENLLSLKLKVIAKSMIVSIVSTIVLIFVLSILLCYSNISEKAIEPSIIFITAFSILLGTFIMEKNIKEKGFIYGGLFGIIYMVILYLISSFLSADFSVGFSSIIMVLFGILAGVIGGILGVNIKNKNI